MKILSNTQPFAVLSRRALARTGPAAVAIAETPFFYKVGGDEVFAILHEPKVLPAATALILCHASAEEKYWSHRVYVNFSRESARQGLAVMRLDFRGEGESDLDFEQAGIATRVEDVVGAVNALTGMRPNLERVVLLGHRLGAMIAATAATQLAGGAAGLVLWDPVFDGREYLMQILRQHLAAQLASGSPVSFSREQLLESLRVGGRLYIEGYGFGEPLVGEMLASTWSQDAKTWSRPALIVEVSGAAPPVSSAHARAVVERFPKVRALAIKEAPFWRETKLYHRRAPRLMAATSDWLAEIFN
jgi:pimeloyl-ACP methyl ester carboxylesterase